MSHNFQKLLLERDGNQLSFGFDIQKATDETQRMVVGFATLDNIDQTGDIVLASASEAAFRTFRGNIREQHNKNSAVGRLVAFEPATYYNPNTQTIHKGIRVAVRISEAAEDTWKKCIDGTYSGFSIKGGILDSEQIVRDGHPVKVIKQYHLTELSIVDNPANELANFETVYKAIDGGGASDIEKVITTQNLFWCSEHKLASQSSDDRLPCAQCGETMAIVGTISRDEDFTEKITKVLDDLEIDKEGVNQMAEEVVKSTEENEATDENKETETSEVAEGEPEEAKEDTAPSVDVDALLTEIKAQLKLVEDNLVTKYNELSTLVKGELEKVTSANSELEKRLGEQDDRLKEVTSATAKRKSEDAEVVEKVDESSDDGWGNLFTGSFDLKNLTTG